ncbi:MAG TPA: hypothetical protein VGN54_06970 [Mycobacteriales bacterium]|jgi:hypothetical protein|nr:hypothetical protein [Mycobacteriales bacterium]
MNHDPTPPGNDDVPLRALEEARERALALLDDPDVPPLDAVVWLSAHLSAIQHVVHPAVARVLRDEPTLTTLRQSNLEIERALRLLERFHSGDWLAIGLDEPAMTRSLVALVTEQAGIEHPLLQRLAEQLSADEQEKIVAAYQHALEHAPTRPHPHSPHGTRLGALAFRVNELRDRIMDTVDSRPIPTPRPHRKLIKPSRWGDYVLGHGSARAPKDH